jgi:hypothetical protein
MRDATLTSRLEAVADRLEALCVRLEAVSVPPGKDAAPEPTPDELKAAERYLEEKEHELGSFARRIESQGGATEEDGDEYFHAWAER